MTISWRDGTSQAGRVLRELDPDHAKVDERTTRDLLAFARAYAGELRYFGVEDAGESQSDWREFIGPSIDLDAAAAYADEPEKFPPDQAAPYARPHFALFLAFLQLLGRAREQSNALTRRHLEFFYRDVLRMVRKRAVPDQVHVLVDLDSRTRELRVPAGTALRAGKDSLQRDLIYRTEHGIVANRVEVARVSSLHAETWTTGIKEASRQHLVSGTPRDAFVAMMRIALGQPNPGDPLPVPVYAGVPPGKSAGNPAAPEVTYDVLVQAHDLIRIVELQLGMPSFDDFRELMRLRGLRQARDTADWAQVNSYIEKAGKKRDPNFKFAPQNARDFDANLRAVLNKTPEEFRQLYDGLPEVKSIEELYASMTRLDVQNFIQTKLYLSLDDFKAMMQTKTVMDNQWAEMYRLLEQAGRRKSGNLTFSLPANVRAARDFNAALTAAVGPPDFKVAGGIEGYWAALLAVEQYFFTSAENFNYIMSVAARGGAPAADDRDWDKVYDIIAAAHTQMIYARRRAALQAAAQPGIGAKDNVRALGDMLAVALGEKREIADALKQLEALGAATVDRQYLETIAAKTEALPDWVRVAKVLEIAQRNRENFKETAPARVEWRNLYPAEDARAVSAQTTDAAAAQSRWKTFGRGEVRRAREPVPPPAFGWALGSPLLELAEGKRTIDLTLGFSGDPVDFDVDKIRALFAPADAAPLLATFNPFQVEVSTSKGWLEPQSVKIQWAGAQMAGYPAVPGADTSKLRALVFSLTFSEKQPALTPLTRDVHGIATSAPVLRLMMKPIWKEQDACYVTLYQPLRCLVLLRARLAVNTMGMTGLQIRNDQSVLDARKPFEPFGVMPAVGSRFYFGHPEVLGKKLDSVSIHIAWMGAPTKLAAHYANYPTSLANTSFTARVGLVDRGVFRDFNGTLPLFDKDDAGKPVAITLGPPADQGNPNDALTAAGDVAEWNRYLAWELNAPDFQHTAYPSVAQQKSLQLAAAVGKGEKPDATAYQINLPYTPKIKSLSLDYTASTEVALGTAAAPDAAARVFHVQPFGYRELTPEGMQSGSPFLPRFDFEGELYIGLTNVSAPQNVSLLFRVAEGSADPDVPPEPVQWSYLSGNSWITLQDGSLLADGTRGLINSGIVELALRPAQPSTLLPGELYWIRAAIARSSACVCDMVEVHPNAVLATFENQDNAPDHLRTPLSPGRITGSVAPIPGIARVRQPYTSFGGKMAEQDTSFYVRVSERLRHKQRALTPWDYERLVLEKFPQIYKAKCLRADQVPHAHDAGNIELIVIPDIRDRLPFDPFEPKAPADLILDIAEFLRDKTPAFAAVTVKNPHYVPVKVRCGVRFVPGQDEGYCRNQLNQELNRFLSPWAYEEGADIVIGGSVYANSIINFIDSREYVDYVAELKLFTSEDDGKTFNIVIETDAYHARAERQDGVLVAARQHEFDVISQADYRLEGYAGINYMRVELDFIVA